MNDEQFVEVLILQGSDSDVRKALENYSISQSGNELEPGA